MPELPEVERATKLIRDVAQNRTIEFVETTEDTIVYTGGISHTEFANELAGRKVLDVKRYGKVFYLELDGDGKMPVLHLGMTGMVQVQGQEPTWYRRRPKDTTQWPPRFMKFILHFSELEGEPPLQVAFMDARRLARIRLCASPTKEPPISELGFDPILSMPALDDFSALVKRRTAPIKALLLDQSFSAGVGNWVADEILYQSRVHPEERANNLDDEQISMLHEMTVFVCKTAVQVNADSSQFPNDWLFRHRWGKGQKGKAAPFILPSGEQAQIKWMTVGGRTSAVVGQLQKLSGKPTGRGSKGKKMTKPASDDEVEESESEEKPLTDKKAKATTNQKKSTRTRKTVVTIDAQASDDESSLTELSDAPPPKRRKKTSVVVEKTTAVRKTKTRVKNVVNKA